MSAKEFVLDQNIKIKITKRRNSRNIRLSIDSLGQVKVSQPFWAPYSAGLQFARSKAEWINEQLPSPTLFAHGGQIGKFHRLHLSSANVKTVRSKITDTELIVTFPASIGSEHHDVQSKIEKAANLALKQEAAKLLPQRVQVLSRQSGWSYKDLKFKKMKGRWGSCDQHKNITLNIYLMQLPWKLIDYVILHELAHTKHLHHQADFWQDILKVMPDARDRRKEMKNYKPQVFAA